VTDPARRQALRNDAARCYTSRLANDPAAQTYLAGRGIAPELAGRLGLGAGAGGPPRPRAPPPPPPPPATPTRS